MIDITSWVREKIFRRPSLNILSPGEELSEKQTTKMGYFLLICMFLAIISTAQWSLSIIKDIPTRPTDLPQCVTNMVGFFNGKDTDSYDIYSYSNRPYGYSYSDFNGCVLVWENPEFDFTDDYNSLLPIYNQAVEYIDSLNKLKSELTNITYKRESVERDYNTALNENIANTWERIYDTNNAGSTLWTLKAQQLSIEAEMSSLQSKIEDLRNTYQKEATALKSNYETAQNAYKKAYIWFKIYRSLLSLIFIGIIFILLYRVYVRSKLKNSPNTVIFSIATFAYWLVLLQLFCLFLWDVLPHDLLEAILWWISLFTPFVFLLQFIWPIIIVGIFGYLVYRIQKRLYSPQNVLKRFVNDKKCPNCGNAVDITKPFCPLCAQEIHINCQHCKTLTMKWMPYCSTCGKSQNENHVTLK